MSADLVEQLAGIEEARGVLAAEAIVDDALAGSEVSGTSAAPAIDILSRVGRDAEAVGLALKHPEALRNIGCLTQVLQSTAACGHPELIDTLGALRTVSADPAKHLGALGGSLLRSSLQLSQKQPDSETLRRFTNILANTILFAGNDVYGPLILDLHARLFGTLVTTPTITRAARMKDKPTPVWATATLARGEPIYLAETVEAMAGSSAEAFFPEARVIARSGLGSFRERLTPMTPPEAEEAGWRLPSLDKDGLAKGFRDARDTAKEIFDTSPSLLELRKQLEKADCSLATPILVLSTGRAGTRSLNALLQQSEGYWPFHFLNFHQEAGDLNTLFRKIQTGATRRSDLERHAGRFLHDRLIELAWCARHGRRPVIVNHLDLVQAPFYLALFPDLSVLHLQRDAAKTLISHAYKQQFRYQQIRPLYGRIDPQSGVYDYARPAQLTLEQSVVWFQHATKVSAEALSTLTHPGHFRDVNMDRLFARDPAAIRKFAEIFPDPTLSETALSTHFSEKINEKAHYVVPETLRQEGDAKALFEKYERILTEHGGYPD